MCKSSAGESWVKALPGRKTRKEGHRSHLQLKVCEYFQKKEGLVDLKRKYIGVKICENTIFCKGTWCIGNAMI